MSLRYDVAYALRVRQALRVAREFDETMRMIAETVRVISSSPIADFARRYSGLVDQDLAGHRPAGWSRYTVGGAELRRERRKGRA